MPSPDPHSTPQSSGHAPLSLAQGDLGIALAHLAQGSPPEIVHTWLSRSLAGGVTDPTGRAGLFHGLPAVAFTLAHTPPGHYQQARAAVRDYLHQMTVQRLEAAHQRIDRGDLASFTEYDLVSGLTGVGVAVWAIDPSSSLLERVLSYLVRLTRPVRHRGRSYPGWWVHHDPWGRLDPGFPHGHANTGMAHGLGGILSLLALTYRSGRAVPAHREAMETLCAALDDNQRRDETGTWWPRWFVSNSSRTDIHSGPPSWCYGTPGLARAQHLAALALADEVRRRAVEDTFVRTLSNPTALGKISDASLCHGWAGLVNLARAVAADSRTPQRFAPLIEDLRTRLTAEMEQLLEPGLLEGHAGTHLALKDTYTTGWSRVLLLT
ncbi:lanthionine synthetase C family protein [Nocardiopsis sp. CNS-639]|uniref:lanthionine synthetase C family protein n=1 Tax=Nocardiopsis sp. CNS-639 TaxID=1169153 RepID=UPI00037A4BCE|nr:lanthionine synthetase C family protein [Nocardiopsis sp. CNS-639]